MNLTFCDLPLRKDRYSQTARVFCRQPLCGAKNRRQMGLTRMMKRKGSRIGMSIIFVHFVYPAKNWGCNVTYNTLQVPEANTNTKTGHGTARADKGIGDGSDANVAMDDFHLWMVFPLKILKPNVFSTFCCLITRVQDR